MTSVREIAADLANLRTSISNVYFIGNRDGWILVDTGVVGYCDAIREAASERFGPDCGPRAIVLTHGHFDHSAGALELARRWNVPVYAHALERPYLTGQSAYPQKDPTVGGAMAFLSRFFPNRTNNIGEVLRDLPATGEVPGLDGWTAIWTPGHAPGQVSLWRVADRTLVAGDAIATADLDTWYGLVGQKPCISRPPSPFTFDWEKAGDSVRRLADLRPKVIAAGHGEPMLGDRVAEELERFAQAFAPPVRGRYAAAAAVTNEHGVVFEPPPPPDHLPRIAAALVAGTFVFAGVFFSKRGRKSVPGATTGASRPAESGGK
jgi:glyoxylase-like metal-dependent hydrolase (beta-lactamase superfamily II)